MNYKEVLFWLLVATVFLCIGLQSCSSERRATRLAYKSFQVNEAASAQAFNRIFPVQESEPIVDTLFLPDSIGFRETIHEVDSFVYCPDTARNAPVGSVIKVPIKVPCKCVDSIIYRTKTITITKPIKDRELPKKQFELAWYWIAEGLLLMVLLIIFKLKK